MMKQMWTLLMTFMSACKRFVDHIRLHQVVFTIEQKLLTVVHIFQYSVEHVVTYFSSQKCRVVHIRLIESGYMLNAWQL